MISFKGQLLTKSLKQLSKDEREEEKILLHHFQLPLFKTSENVSKVTLKMRYC